MDPRELAAAAIGRLTRLVDDFPEPGVAFKDLTPVLADPEGLATVTDALCAVATDCGGVDLVAGIDARGFLLGGAVALRLGVGVLAIRKAGKLPPPVLSQSYDLEYGSATLEIPGEGIALRGKRILIVDDVLATGGTGAAVALLLQRAGAVSVGIAVLMELPELDGRARIQRLTAAAGGADIPIAALTQG